MTEKVPEIIKQVPEIRIIGGVVSTPQSKPYLIKELSSGKLVCIIDTSGQYASLDKSDAKILLTKTKLQYRQSDYEIREYSTANINDVTINDEVITGWARIIDSWLAFILAPFILIGMYVLKLLAALLYSVIALIIAELARIKTPYSSKLSIAIIAMTPASLIIAVFEVLSINVPQEYLFSILATSGYILFGLIANKSELT